MIFNKHVIVSQWNIVLRISEPTVGYVDIFTVLYADKKTQVIYKKENLWIHGQELLMRAYKYISPPLGFVLWIYGPFFSFFFSKIKNA